MARCGFVSVIGRTNAGKSSLINSLLGQKLAMVSHKQNATRRKINAIVMSGDNQIIFTDTPGLHNSQKSFNQHLIKSAIKSIDNCDLVLFVVSALDGLHDYEEFLSLSNGKAHILVINKVDLIDNKNLLELMQKYSKYSNNFISLVPFSCKKKSYINYLLEEIAKNLPEHEYFFDPENISDSSVKDIVSDLILESIFDNVSDEVPYCCDVQIDNFYTAKGNVNVSASIITDTDSHKSILIGKDGCSIKRIGINSRKKISSFLDSKVNLNLIVSIKKNWHKDDKVLKELKIYCDE